RRAQRVRRERSVSRGNDDRPIRRRVMTTVTPVKGTSEMFRNKAKRALVALTTTAVVAATLVVTGGTAAAAADVLPGVAPIEQRNAATVTADALPTVQL